MSTRVNAEELESTRTEKFLAVVLTAFLLVGAVWFYVEVDDWVRGEDRYSYSPEQEAELRELYRTIEAGFRAEEDLQQAKNELDLAREDYQIALETEEAVAEKEAAYQREQEEYAEALARRDEAREAARAAEAEQNEIFDAQSERADDPTRAWIVAGVRLGFIMLWILGSYRLIQVLRRRESRYQPVGFAMAATGAILSLVYATDYILDYLDPLELGPIVLSVFGVVATLAAFVFLQRYLARRIPGRRVRKGECPFCGYPVRGDGPHCEGCGREVIAECASCAQPRRVGSTHCIACGAV